VKLSPRRQNAHVRLRNRRLGFLILPLWTVCELYDRICEPMRGEVGAKTLDDVRALD
jgi:hypothetical protein